MSEFKALYAYQTDCQIGSAKLFSALQREFRRCSLRHGVSLEQAAVYLMNSTLPRRGR